MKQILTMLVAVAAITAAWAQAHLSITQNGRLLGYATVTAHLEKDGSKTVSLRMELTSQNSKASITTEARYDSGGVPVRMFQQTIVPGGALTKQVIANFNKDGASVTVLDGEKRAMKNATLAETAPRADLSQFWFIRDKPKIGQVEQAYQFNTNTLEWDLARTEYVGDKVVKAGGHSVQGHQVVTKRGDSDTVSYLDDEGLPLIIEQGLIKMERIWPK